MGGAPERTEESRIFAPGLLGGHVALVTGGGTGLGRETALELVRCGASVTIAGRRVEVLEAAAASIAPAAGPGGGRSASSRSAPCSRGWAAWTCWSTTPAASSSRRPS